MTGLAPQSWYHTQCQKEMTRNAFPRFPRMPPISTLGKHQWWPLLMQVLRRLRVLLLVVQLEIALWFVILFEVSLELCGCGRLHWSEQERERPKC